MILICFKFKIYFHFDTTRKLIKKNKNKIKNHKNANKNMEAIDMSISWPLPWDDTSDYMVPIKGKVKSALDITLALIGIVDMPEFLKWQKNMNKSIKLSPVTVTNVKITQTSKNVFNFVAETCMEDLGSIKYNIKTRKLY